MTVLHCVAILSTAPERGNWDISKTGEEILNVNYYYFFLRGVDEDACLCTESSMDLKLTLVYFSLFCY